MLFIIFIYMHVCVGTHITVHMEQLKHNLCESILLLHHVGPRDQTEVISPGAKHLYLLSQLASRFAGV